MSYFNTEEIQEGIPEGRYNFVIESCEAKMTKTNKNMICLRLKIVEGEQENRMHFENLVIGDQGYAGDIARRKFKEIILACGFKAINSPSDLDNKFFNAKTTNTINKDGNSECRLQDFREYGYKPSDIPDANKKVTPKIPAKNNVPSAPEKPIVSKVPPAKSPVSRLSQLVNKNKAVVNSSPQEEDIPF